MPKNNPYNTAARLMMHHRHWRIARGRVPLGDPSLDVSRAVARLLMKGAAYEATRMARGGDDA